MKKHGSVWLWVGLSLLLAACGSSSTPRMPTITTQAVNVEYELEAGFAAYQRGDINRDGRVSTADLRILSGVLASGDVSGLDDYRRYQADFTCDGILNNDDIREIQDRVANDKAPAEIQVCPNIEVLTDDEIVVLVSNIGDLPLNGFQILTSAGIDISLIPTIYRTATPTTFVYSISVAEGVTEGSISIEGNTVDFEVDVALGNIAEIVASRPELSVLLDAVLAAGLADALSGDTELTVFAPDNEAFLDLLDELELDSLEALIAAVGIEEVTDILSFHVVAGIATAADLVNLINDNGGQPIKIETLTGDFLTVSLDDGMLTLQDDIEVLEANIPASNGIIHIIDTVLNIPAETSESTIAELAATDADLSSLVANLNAAQLALLSDATANLTVLAPVNSAFEAAAGLLATLSAEEIAEVINYHVLVGRFLAADVIALDGQTLPDTDIAVSVIDGSVFLQGGGNDAPIQVIATDILASNGVIHKLAGILLPAAEPAPQTIAEIAVGEEDLTSLVANLNDDQVNLLSDATQNLTVFAPVNSAFEAATDLLATLTPEEITNVINYHVLVGEFLAADVVALDGQTLPDSNIVVSVVDGTVFLQGAGNTTPVEVIEVDIDAENGVIHKLAGVLLPS